MKNKKKKLKLLLLILALIISIGYAAIRSGLNINGTTHVMNNTWDVHFENYQRTSSSTVTPTTAPDTTGNNKTTVTYEVTLTNPGDIYEFTLDVVNSGTMDVMIESFSSKLNNTEITSSNLPGYLEYSVTYDDGVALANNQALAHNTTEKVKLRIKYRDDIETTALPGTSQDLSFSFSITYVQATNEAIVRNSQLSIKNESSGQGEITYNVRIWGYQEIFRAEVGNGIGLGINGTDASDYHRTLLNPSTTVLSKINNNSYYLRLYINDVISWMFNSTNGNITYYEDGFFLSGGEGQHFLTSTDIYADSQYLPTMNEGDILILKALNYYNFTDKVFDYDLNSDIYEDDLDEYIFGGYVNEITIKNGETIFLANLPIGYRYEIEQLTPDGWELLSINGDNSLEVATGIIDNNGITYTFRNEKTN